MVRGKNARGKLPKNVLDFDRCCRALSRPKELADEPNPAVDGNGDFHLEDDVIVAAYRATCEFPALLSDKSVRKRIRDQPTIIKHMIPNVEFWVSYFAMFINEYDFSFLPPTSDPDVRASPAADLCRFIARFQDSGTVLPCITNALKDVRLFDFIVTSWMSQDQETFGGAMDDLPEDLHVDSSSPYPAFALSTFVNLLSESKAIDRIVQVAGGSSQIVVASALERLRAILEKSPSTCESRACLAEDMQAHASLVRCLLAARFAPECKSGSQLSDALFKDGAILLLTRTLRECAEIVMEGDSQTAIELQRFHEFGAALLKQMNLTMLGKNASVQILEILSGGILDIIGNSWVLQHSKSGHHESFRDAMSTSLSILQRHLFNYNILEAVIDAFDGLDAKQRPSIARIPEMQKLLNATMDRAIIQNLYHRAEDITRGTRANNRHSGCEGQCNLCNFVLFLAKTDVHNCLSGIIEYARRDWPEVSLNELAVHVSYDLPQSVDGLKSRLSPVISTSLFEELPEATRKMRRICRLENCDCNELFITVDCSLDDIEYSSAFTTMPPCMDDDCICRIRLTGPMAKNKSAHRIDRVDKFAPDGSAYETVQWDDVDEIWERALRFKSSNNLLGMIDRAVAELDFAARLHATRLCNTAIDDIIS